MNRAASSETDRPISRRDHYAVVFDQRMVPISMMSDLPPIDVEQAKWITGIY
jgi:hypothetical protein